VLLPADEDIRQIVHQRRLCLREPAPGRPFLPFLGTVKRVSRHEVAEEPAQVVPRHFMAGVGYLLQKILQGHYFQQGILSYTPALFCMQQFEKTTKLWFLGYRPMQIEDKQ